MKLTIVWLATLVSLILTLGACGKPGETLPSSTLAYRAPGVIYSIQTYNDGSAKVDCSNDGLQTYRAQFESTDDGIEHSYSCGPTNGEWVVNHTDTATIYTDGSVTLSLVTYQLP